MSEPRFVPLLDAPGDPDGPSLLIAVQGNRVVLLDGEPETAGIFLGTLDGRHCWAVDVDPKEGERDDVVDLFRLWSTSTGRASATRSSAPSGAISGPATAATS